MDFALGDKVSAVMKDGRVFEGVLLDWREYGGVLCVFLTPGLGLVADDILTMTSA